MGFSISDSGQSSEINRRLAFLFYTSWVIVCNIVSKVSDFSNNSMKVLSVGLFFSNISMIIIINIFKLFNSEYLLRNNSVLACIHVLNIHASFQFNLKSDFSIKCNPSISKSTSGMVLRSTAINNMNLII